MMIFPKLPLRTEKRPDEPRKRIFTFSAQKYASNHSSQQNQLHILKSSGLNSCPIEPFKQRSGTHEKFKNFFFSSQTRNGSIISEGEFMSNKKHKFSPFENPAKTPLKLNRTRENLKEDESKPMQNCSAENFKKQRIRGQYRSKLQNEQLRSVKRIVSRNKILSDCYKDQVECGHIQPQPLEQEKKAKKRSKIQLKVQKVKGVQVQTQTEVTHIQSTLQMFSKTAEFSFDPKSQLSQKEIQKIQMVKELNISEDFSGLFSKYKVYHSKAQYLERQLLEKEAFHQFICKQLPSLSKAIAPGFTTKELKIIQHKAQKVQQIQVKGSKKKQKKLKKIQDNNSIHSESNMQTESLKQKQISLKDQITLKDSFFSESQRMQKQISRIFKQKSEFSEQMMQENALLLEKMQQKYLESRLFFNTPQLEHSFMVIEKIIQNIGNNFNALVEEEETASSQNEIVLNRFKEVGQKWNQTFHQLNNYIRGCVQGCQKLIGCFESLFESEDAPKLKNVTKNNKSGPVCLSSAVTKLMEEWNLVKVQSVLSAKNKAKVQISKLQSLVAGLTDQDSIEDHFQPKCLEEAQSS